MFDQLMSVVVIFASNLYGATLLIIIPNSFSALPGIFHHAHLLHHIMQISQDFFLQ